MYSHWFYVYVLPLMPAALTIAGWYFVYWREQSKRVSDRKYQRVEAAIKLLVEIEGLAIAYYCSDVVGSESAAVDINFKMKHLSQMCQKISVEIDIFEFKSVVTGGDFQSSKRKKLGASHELIYRIRDTSFQLSVKLDSQYDV